MFRVRQVAESSVLFWLTFGLLIIMVATTGVTVWLIAEVRKEQVAIQAIVAGGNREVIRRLGNLPFELRWQFVLTIVVLVVLIAAAVLLAFVVRALVKSRVMLRDVRMLAWDILSSMDHAVITTDRAGRVTTINPRGNELMELATEVEGRRLQEVCPITLPLADISDTVLRTGERQSVRELTYVRQGHSLRLQVEGHILRDADEHVSGTVLHIRDVTESSLLEESIRRMERFSGLGPLVAGLHHEINNPLSALLLHVRLLEERLQGQADEEVSETLRIITTEVKRIAGVLRSFRDYAHLETLDCRATDLVGLARQTVELVRPQAEQQRVHIRVEAAENLPAVHADAARLGQVLLNLVLNALDEMPHGGSLIVQIQHSTDDEVALLVTDTGCGIPENIRPRIFDPYFTTKIDGSGMGLAFCDKIVREHGGRIDVTTNKTGTTFRVNLPLGSA